MIDPAAPAPSPAVWFLTGASSGLGRALAEAVLDAGHHLVATARQPTSLADLAALHPARCELLTLDVTDPVQIRQTLAEATRRWGRLDVVVNNAGCGLLGAVEESGDDEIQRTFATNLFGPIQITRAALPVLRAQGSGHFVFISAAAAISNYPGFGIYGAAKAALDALAESLRAETTPLGLRVTVVHPGPFRTDFIRRSLHRTTHTLPAYTPTVGKFAETLARLDGRQSGDPTRAAHLLVHLVSSGQAPFHLPLGRYTIEKLKRRAAATAQSAAHWETAACQSDHPPAEPPRPSSVPQPPDP